MATTRRSGKEKCIAEDRDSSSLEKDRKDDSIEEEINGCSEESIEIEPELWEENTSSDVEIINLPADKVMKMLKGKKK
ncbi:hypothetical protein GINT2_000797 [Glugoides intestinalis]